MRWLLKAEPEDYTFTRLMADGRTAWTGVRNHQAANNLHAMQAGDPALFYRSVVAPAIVGLMRVVRTAYHDPTADDPRWVCVDLVPVRPLQPIPLRAIKADGRFKDFALVRQSRLSVVPVRDGHWAALGLE